MAEADEIDDALTGQVRVVLTSAAQAAERIYRQREWRQREGTQEASTERDRLSERYESERRAAHAQLRETDRDRWVEKARPDQIGAAYQVARAWSLENDPYAREVEQRIGRDVKDRYGVDVDGLAGAEVTDQVKQATSERAKADAERQQGTSLMESAERAPSQSQSNAADTAADLKYDSAERRDAQAAAMLAANVPPAAVEASTLESTSNAEPARNAVKRGRGRTGRAPGTSAGNERQRGLER